MQDTRFDCTTAQEMISEQLDGQLTDTKQKQLEMHLASCEACRAELSAQKSIRALLSKAAYEVPGELRSNVMRMIENIPQEDKLLRSRRRFIPWGTIAAACAVVMLLVAGRHTINLSSPDSGLVADDHDADPIGYVLEDPTFAEERRYENSDQTITDENGVIVETTASVTVFSPNPDLADTSVKDTAGESEAALDRVYGVLAADEARADRGVLILHEADFDGIAPSVSPTWSTLDRYEMTCYEITEDASNAISEYLCLFEQLRLSYRAIIPENASFDICEIWLIGAQTGASSQTVDKGTVN